MQPWIRSAKIWLRVTYTWPNGTEKLGPARRRYFLVPGRNPKGIVPSQQNCFCIFLHEVFFVCQSRLTGVTSNPKSQLHMIINLLLNHQNPVQVLAGQPTPGCLHDSISKDSFIMWCCQFQMWPLKSPEGENYGKGLWDMYSTLHINGNQNVYIYILLVGSSY